MTSGFYINHCVMGHKCLTFVGAEGVEPPTLCLYSEPTELSSRYSFLLSDNCVRPHILPPHNHQVAASVGVCLPCSHLKTNFVLSVLFVHYCVGLRIIGQSLPEGNSLPLRLSALS